MLLARKISLLFFLFSSIIAMGQQGYTYSYIDPCTSKAKEIFIDTSSGSVPLTYNGQIHSFTTAELQSGAFQAWIDSVNLQNPSGPCSGVGLAQNTTINVMVAQNNISVITTVMSTLSTMASMQDVSTSTAGLDTGGSGMTDAINSTTEDVTSIGGSSVQGVIQTDEKVSSNNDKENKQNNGNNSTNSNNGSTNNSVGSTSNTNGNQSTSNSQGNQTSIGTTSGSAGNQGTNNSTTSGPTTTGSQTSQSSVTNNGSSNSVSNNGSSNSVTSNNNSSGNSVVSNSSSSNGMSNSSNGMSNSSNSTANSNNSTTTNSNNPTNSSQNLSGGQTQGQTQGQSVVDNSSSGGSGINNVTGSIGSVKTDNTQQSESDNSKSDDAKSASEKTLNSVASSSSSTKSKVAAAKKGNLMMNGDLVTIASATGDPSQFKFNASIISSNTKNTFAKGALINFTSYVNNSNVTLFVSYRHKKLTSIFANSMMMNFQRDFFDTFSLMESYKYHKVTGTLGVNLTVGNIGSSKFQSLSALGGVFGSFKLNKKMSLTTMFVTVYSPYVYYYQGMWYQSGTLLVPFTAIDYKIIKKFKLNLSFSAVEQINDKAISYQILTGAKCLL